MIAEIVSTGIPPLNLLWLAFSVFLLGMAKGGFPIGNVALPLIILSWPASAEATRQAVAFMLPILCLMDIGAWLFYHRHIQWKILLPLFPGMLAGIALGAILFVFSPEQGVGLSDRLLRLIIGLLGVAFSFWHGVRHRVSGWNIRRLPERVNGILFGATAGLTSTLAHAAGPVMQIYLLPRNLPKMQFAATIGAFFLVLNGIKLVPFALAGRFTEENISIAMLLFPLIPAGVACGYILVKRTHQKHYTKLIQFVLFGASVLLIVRAVLDK